MIVAGNHDSVATLNESAIFWRSSIPPWWPAPARAADPEKTTARRARGAVPNPVLRPRDIVQSRAGLSGSEKQQHLVARPSPAIITSQHTEACALRGDQPYPIIATGHLHRRSHSRVMRCADLSVRWTRFRRPTSPADYICPRAYSPGADHRRLRAYSLLRLAHFPQF